MTVEVVSGREMVFDRLVSVQFARPILVRFVRTMPASAPWGMAWIEVYQITSWGDAIRKRELLVRVDGLLRAARFGLTRHRRPKRLGRGFSAGHIVVDEAVAV